MVSSSQLESWLTQDKTCCLHQKVATVLASCENFYTGMHSTQRGQFLKFPPKKKTH